MPPKGVTVLAQATNEQQVQWLARQLAEATLPVRDLTEYMGEDPTTVLRVRKTPEYWHLERWPRHLLTQTEGDVSFP